MTLYDLVNKCACKLDAIEIRVNDSDFGDDMTISTYTYPELLAREGAGARTKAVKRGGLVIHTSISTGMIYDLLNVCLWSLYGGDIL